MRSHRHPIVTVLLLSAAPVAASPAHRVPSADLAAGTQLPQVRTERTNLLQPGRDQARMQVIGFGPLCDEDADPLVGNVAFKGDTYEPRSKAHPAPPADSAVSRQLLTLRADLLHAGRDKAQAELARFRPLCDQDGYPLVGNVASKGDMYQPSQFCSDVRKTEKRT